MCECDILSELAFEFLSCVLSLLREQRQDFWLDFSSPLGFNSQLSVTSQSTLSEWAYRTRVWRHHTEQLRSGIFYVHEVAAAFFPHCVASVLKWDLKTIQSCNPTLERHDAGYLLLFNFEATEERRQRAENKPRSYSCAVMQSRSNYRYRNDILTSLEMDCLLTGWLNATSLL